MYVYLKKFTRFKFQNDASGLVSFTSAVIVEKKYWYIIYKVLL